MTAATVVGLFAGVGGIELGLKAAGFRPVLLCEIDPSARMVLEHRFGLPRDLVHDDVATMTSLPPADVVTAGFPCQDLSQAGRKAGIKGTQSSLVAHLFRLMDTSPDPTWVVLENVSYMLSLDQGRGMMYLIHAFEDRGFAWAYRVVDSRAFGVAQRRQRVILVASRKEDPREVLLADESGTDDYEDRVGPVDPRSSYGFYWTEGLRGLGWTANAVPTIKGGSRLGIPSPPAVWVPHTDKIGTPSIEDLEALQGFPRGWTVAADLTSDRNSRWRLIGNAVCADVSAWLGERLIQPSTPIVPWKPLSGDGRWPKAAWGDGKGRRYAAEASMRPFAAPFDLQDTITELRPLSERATAGFLERARRGKLRFSDGFLAALERHLVRVRLRFVDAA
jgi:DNA (cytosine-5)-methyltransferase 1